MAKKKAVRRDDGKARLEIRFDSDVYEKIKAVADKAEISVNQLLHGLARWAANNAQIGEPQRDEQGHLHNRRQPGVVWFGKPSSHYPSGVALDEHGDPEPYESGWTEGKMIFSLDFTERRVIRNDV